MPRPFAPNWFLAIPVPTTTWFEHIPPVPEGIRRFHPEDVHLTVTFLGAVGEQRARLGWDSLRWSLSPVIASLGAVVPMGSPHRYSALSIELLQARDVIEQAIFQCRDLICDAASIPRESRKPKAHITIARPTRRAGDEERAKGLVWAKRIDFHQPTIYLDTLALYTWSEDRKERQFQIVETKPFQNPLP